ncbi:MAG: plasmid pRiA4b ORF-3 family protein [Selenomonadaceae bacterium]|nr:plasmid pRiA4b ORF-3 family protein [Selenomonadaceae bacterium]
MAEKIFYQFKITLKYSKPPIWRRVIVPAEYTFQEFAEVILMAMGWSGYHLSEFEMNEGTHIKVNFPVDDGGLIDDFDESVNASEVELVNYLDTGEKFIFTYDFGDNWEHVVLFEKIAENYKKDYPSVIKFKGNCPPEDCGGIFGYYNLLESDTYDEETAGILADVKDYDIDDVNEALRKYFSGEVRTIYA